MELMDRYAQCADSDEVLAVQEEFMAKGNQMFKSIAEGDTEEEEEEVPWFMQGAVGSSEEEYDEEQEPELGDEPVPDALDFVDVSIRPAKEVDQERSPTEEDAGLRPHEGPGRKEKAYKRAL